MSQTTKAFHRFSNENIFKEREKGLEKNEISLSIKYKNKTTIDFFYKKKKEEKRNCVYSSFLSTSTTFLLKEISDISTRKNLWDKIFNNFKEYKQKSEEKNNETSKSSDIYSIKKSNIKFRNDFYLTGFHKINDSKYISQYNNKNDININAYDYKKKTKKKLINKERNLENLMNKTHSKSFLLLNNRQNQKMIIF